MSDTFEKLVADMRGWTVQGEPDTALEGFADRLEALVGQHTVLPHYGEAGSVEAIDSDPPPILADLLKGHDVPPGSDWVLIDPVSMTDEQRERHEKGRGRSVTGDG